jgi:hypothetical protein
MENDLLKSYINNPEELNEESLVGIKKLTEEYPFFQSGWMLYLKNLKNVNHSDFDTELQRIAIRVTNRKKLFFLLNSNQKNQSGNFHVTSQGISVLQIEDVISLESETPTTQSAGSNLIDNFIASKPTIRIKNNVVIPHNTDFSEESVSENDEIFTETFANILVNQKKYDKAIESFEKLSLRFPEKNIYFARRIEEIQNLKNN